MKTPKPSFDVPSFRAFIQEDANATAGVESGDMPIAKKKPDEEEEHVESLREDLNVPNLESGKGKKRGHLPQIVGFEEFLSDLQASNISMKFHSVDPHELTPTQSNFNEKKVDAIVASGGAGMKPIIISQDGFIIDGHHRWLAAVKSGTNINVKEVALDCEDLLGFLCGKPYVEKHNIDECVLAEGTKWDPHVGWIGGASDEPDDGYRDPRGGYYYKVVDGKNVKITYPAASNKPYKRPQGALSRPAMSKWYMLVPYKDREAAKAEGMKWDPAAKAWYFEGSSSPVFKSKFKIDGKRLQNPAVRERLKAMGQELEFADLSQTFYSK